MKNSTENDAVATVNEVKYLQHFINIPFTESENCKYILVSLCKELSFILKLEIIFNTPFKEERKSK